MNFTVKVPLDHEGKVPQAGVHEDGRDHRTADNDLHRLNVEQQQQILRSFLLKS